MAYNKNLAKRLQKAFQKYRGTASKEMFGGIAIMLNGKMCCGVIKNNLVVRVGPKNYEKVLTKPNVRPMDFTGRPLRGFVYVTPAGCKSSKSLAQWVSLGVSYVNSIS